MRRMVGLAAMVLLLAPPVPAEARRVHGATVPEPSDPVGSTGAHFIVRKDWDKTMEEIRKTYGSTPGVVIRRLSTPPRVRAYVVENTRAGRTWDAINVYEDLEEKAVYVTVLPPAARERE